MAVSLHFDVMQARCLDLVTKNFQLILPQLKGPLSTYDHQIEMSLPFEIHPKK